MAEAKKVLELSDIHAGYGDTDILHGINMHVCDDEVVVVIGPNGAGKSTAVKAILGLLNIRKGDVLLMHGFAWHEAWPNTGPTDRFGVYLKYHARSSPPATGGSPLQQTGIPTSATVQHDHLRAKLA